MTELVTYRLQRRENIGDIAAQIYEYVFAANGTFVRARREGLEVCFPIGENRQPVRGLVDCNPVLKMAYPKVPAELLREVLESSLAAKDPQGKPLEILFYLIWNEGWELKIPAQKQTATSCQPLDSADPAYLASVIELHSHNGMEAFFSRQDDLDETGFKIYAVLGDIYRAPKLSVRVGLQGYFWQLPAEEIFNLPDIIQDGAKG